MSLPGSAAPKWFASWLRLIVDQLIVGSDPACPPVAYDGPAAKAAESYPDDLFGLYVGPQWLQAWGSTKTCVIVPGAGEPAPTMAFHTQGLQRPLGAISLSVDIHIWGDELLVEHPSPSDTIYHDIERYEGAGIITQNVMRAVLLSCIGAGLTYGTVDGWQNDTEQLRFGESFVLRVAVGFPIYDFAGTAIPQPQALSPRVTVKQPGE